MKNNNKRGRNLKFILVDFINRLIVYRTSDIRKFKDGMYVIKTINRISIKGYFNSGITH